MHENRDQALGTQVRVMQIIVAALAMGVITFGVMFAGFLVKPQELQPTTPMLTTLSVVWGIVAMGLSLVLPWRMIAAARRKIANGTWTSASQATAAAPALAALGTDGQLVMVYQTALIVGVALLEGTAFLALAATMIEKSSIALAVAGVCLLLILTRFPTLGRVERWLDNQHRALDADRMRLP